MLLAGTTSSGPAESVDPQLQGVRNTIASLQGANTELTPTQNAPLIDRSRRGHFLRGSKNLSLNQAGSGSFSVGPVELCVKQVLVLTLKACSE